MLYTRGKFVNDNGSAPLHRFFVLNYWSEHVFICMSGGFCVFLFKKIIGNNFVDSGDDNETNG